MSNLVTIVYRKLFLSVFCCINLVSLHSQVMEVSDAATPPYTPESIISDIFLGEGVDVKSVTFSGDPGAIGVFLNGQNAVGITRGIVLTTGRVASDAANSVIGCDRLGADFASTSNGSTANFPLLAGLTTGPLRDIAYITIRFCPTSDTLRFSYCFASEEYPEYGCSQYNDVFGFFISGPGYATPKNIALIPGTNLPVAINNLHPANNSIAGCTPFNEAFYNNNTGTMLQPTYDGLTDVFVATAIVQPCKEYVMQIAIADVNDARWDSGVFLAAKSFGTSSLKAEIVTPPASATMAEGCDSLTLRITLPEPTLADRTISLNIRGTAVNGTDYCAIVDGVKGPMPTSVRFKPGQDTLDIPLFAKLDNSTEITETILIDYQRNPCRRDTVRAFIVDNIMKAPKLRPDTLLCSGAFQPLTLNGTVPVLVPPPPLFTNTADVNMPFPFFTYSSSINVTGIVPTKLGPDMIASVCLNIDHAWDDDLDIFLVAPNGQQIALSTDNGGQGDNYRNTCFTVAANTAITAGTAPFTGNYRPETPLSDLYGGPVNGTWRLRIYDDALGQSGILRDWTINFEPKYQITYQWQPPAGLSCTNCPLAIANPTQTTTYIVKVEDTYGCEAKDTINIAVKQSLEAPKINCDNPDLTSVTFHWTNVPQSTGYEINTGTGWRPAPLDSTLTIGNLAPSTPITLQVRGIGGPAQCPPLITAKTCANCADIGASAVPKAVSCAGGADGSFAITPDGKLPPYQYKFGTQTNATGVFTGIKSGNFAYTVVDGVGCQKIFNISILSPDTLTTTLTTKDISCFGGSNGTLTAIPVGGTGNKSYTWSFSNQTSVIASNLTIGTYTVTVRDANGCTAAATAAIKQPDDIQLNAQGVDAKCFDQPTGAVNLVATGGTVPYRFLWNNSSTMSNINGVKAGTYTVTLTDVGGCTKTKSTTIGQPAALITPVTANSLSCFNSTNGTASVAPSGGTPPYKFVWNNGNTSASINNLTATNYLVTVTDANGCTEVGLGTVSAPPAITANTTFTQVSCFNGNNGTAVVTAAGGAGSFTYKWSDPAQQTTLQANTLKAGTYSVTVTDINSCTQVSEISVTQPSAINTLLVSKDATCFGDNNGSIDVSTKGGVPSYTFNWSNGVSTQNLANVAPGIYSVTIKDANGCTNVYQQTIASPPALVTDIKADSVRCFGNPEGAINLSVTGGTPGNTTPYTIAWSGAGNFSSTALVVQNLFAGDYAVTITDQKGCRKILMVPIYEPTELKLELPTIADTICFRGTNGMARALPAGGTAPYRYSWSNSATGATITNLKAGEFEVTVRDAKNCTLSGKTQIQQKAEVFALATFKNPSCRNGKNGVATASSIFYGPDPANPANFRYLWSTIPPQTTQTATGLSANGAFTVTVTDADGCSTTRDVKLGNPDTLIVLIPELTDAKCFGEANGSARAVGAGGTAPYTYFWGVTSPAQRDSLITGLPAGKYNVTVTDTKNCPAVTVVTIKQPERLDTRFAVTGVKCFGGSDGTVTAQPVGGKSPFTYRWQDGQTSKQIIQQKAGRVAITITDANNCALSTVTEVNQPNSPVDGTVESKDAVCFGAANGNITLKGTGGTPPYYYSLNKGKPNGSPLQIGLKAGNYIPEIVDANGCISVLRNIIIGQRPPVKVDLGPDIVINLGQDTTLLAVASEAVLPVTFDWEQQDAGWLSCLDCENPDVSKLYFTRDFKVLATDSLGCTAEDLIRIDVRKVRSIYVPEGFTPNDDQNNDILMVHGQKDAKILRFSVYDRWGELLYTAENFEPNDRTIGWDGSFRGQPNDPGVYVWVLEVEFLDGIKEKMKGHSVLIR